MRPEIDMNLFFIAESLYRTLNVSRSARELNLSQSAVSHALARLREHFHDPLFVRVSKGMAATELAKSLRPRIEELVLKARSLSQAPEVFDPSQAKGRIVIATTDLIEVLLMPTLVERLKRDAPNLQISLRPTGGELPKAELENGQYDLAIAGFYKDVPEGFYQSKALELGFSTAYRNTHPLARRGLTAKQFFDSDHALITLQGDFKDSLSRSKANDKQRRFAYGSYSFTGIAWTLASTDLVLTAPTMLLEKYQEYFPIKIQKTPFEVPKITIRMIWHSLTHRDPLRMWLRDVLKSEFGALQAKAKSRQDSQIG